MGNKIFKLILSALILASYTCASAHLPGLKPAAADDAKLSDYLKTLAAKAAKPAPRAGRTIASWAQNISEDNLRVSDLLAILNDEAYVQSDNFYQEESCIDGYQGPLQCELFAALLPVLAQAPFSASEAKALSDFLAEKLFTPYNSKAANYQAMANYSLMAAQLVSNDNAGREIFERLLAPLANISQNDSPARVVWAARALAAVPWFSPYQLNKLTRTFEPSLRSLGNLLKNLQDDRTAYGARLNNQALAIKIFATKTALLAQQGDESMAELFITTGTMAGPGRATYIQNDYPGMNGNTYATTKNGYQHNIAFNMIATLFNAYLQLGQPQRMDIFIATYARLSADKKSFSNYFLFAMHGLDIAFDLQDSQTLEGWGEQYDIFTTAMTKASARVSTATLALANVQAAAEVAAEWAIMGQIFGLAGKTLKPLGRAAGRFVPAGAGTGLKNVATKSLRPLAIVSVGAMMTQDRSANNQTIKPIKHITMPKEEVETLLLLN